MDGICKCTSKSFFLVKWIRPTCNTKKYKYWQVQDGSNPKKKNYSMSISKMIDLPQTIWLTLISTECDVAIKLIN